MPAVTSRHLEPFASIFQERRFSRRIPLINQMLKTASYGEPELEAMPRVAATPRPWRAYGHAAPCAVAETRERNPPDDFVHFHPIGL